MSIEHKEHAQRIFDGLGGGAKDTMAKLFLKGPIEDGDVPSKAGRDELVDLNLATQFDGWNFVTAHGVWLATRVDVSGWADLRWHRKQKGLLDA